MAAGSGLGPYMAFQFRAAGKEINASMAVTSSTRHRACADVTPARHGIARTARAKQVKNTAPRQAAVRRMVLRSSMLRLSKVCRLLDATRVGFVPFQRTRKFRRLVLVVPSNHRLRNAGVLPPWRNGWPRQVAGTESAALCAVMGHQYSFLRCDCLELQGKLRVFSAHDGN